MADGNTNNSVLTPDQKLAENLTKVCRELWDEASAQFATKQEAGANYASVATCEAIIDELT